MQKIISEDVFTDDALNIFTDASIKNITYPHKETLACAGVTVVHGNKKSQEDHFMIVRNTTNNNAEAKAIRLGVQCALRYKDQYNTIRLFSDSQISIFGIRDRIFNWYLNQNGQYIGSEGKAIKNQDIMLEIVNTIIENNLRIELYHQAGHVKYDKDSLIKAIHVFTASNKVRSLVSYEFIKTISQYNNYVDQTSRNKLKSLDISTLTSDMFIEPIIFNYQSFDKDKYTKLIR